MRLKLVRLSAEYKTQLIDMIEEWSEYNNTNPVTNHSPWAIFKNDCHDFDYYLENLDQKREENGKVVSSTFFCLDEERNIFVGAANIRHTLNPQLLIDGGHIGDGVRPSERQKGVATKMVALALEECRKIGLNRVLMVCDRDNIGSRKSITNNGGILESEITLDGNVEQRYWIELNPNNRLEAEHIVLRKAKQGDDVYMLKNIWGNEDVYKTMWFNPTFTKEDGEARLLRTINFQSYMNGYFVALKETDEPIGLCAIKEEEPGVWEESGICIASQYQGLGYGREMLALLLDLAFNKYNAKEFIYALMYDNTKSRALMNRYKFKLHHKTRETRPWDKQEFDLEYYSLSREDYINER